jgi:hypothetical protein
LSSNPVRVHLKITDGKLKIPSDWLCISDQPVSRNLYGFILEKNYKAYNILKQKEGHIRTLLSLKGGWL